MPPCEDLLPGDTGELLLPGSLELPGERGGQRRTFHTVRAHAEQASDEPSTAGRHSDPALGPVQPAAPGASSLTASRPPRPELGHTAGPELNSQPAGGRGTAG